MARKDKKSLGELLLEYRVISQLQLEQAKAEEKKSGQPIRKVMTRLGIISEEDMVNFVSRHLDVPRIELNNYVIDPKFIALVPEELARKYQLIPVLKVGSNLTCAMVDVFNIFAIDEVALKTGLTVEPAAATEEEIKKAIEENYSLRGSIREVIGSMDESKLTLKGDGLEIEKIKGIAEEPPVVRLVNLMVAQAAREGASDIHIEPEENIVRVRFRIDGILHERESPPKYFQAAVISRIKILAEMNISQRRKPQDGRFKIKLDNRQIDIRVSCIPTVYGENVVMRLLDTGNIILGLDQIGFSTQLLKNYRELISRPNGIILVTGPTGSGKTTTLYTSLNAINTKERNIVTIEDPVEYHLSGVRQMQVDPQVGVDFADGLRSILRQDPDVIMVGEIRDLQTAEIAIQASLTGHLVFSTLHTNNAAGAVTRLIDLGVEPFLLASSISGVLAQRLIRTMCSDCKGKGCKNCLNTGYKGRAGIYELMVSNDRIRALMAAKATAEDIHKCAVELGMKTLLDDGLDKVIKGITTKEEILRVTLEKEAHADI